jgi:hypothetical protein
VGWKYIVFDVGEREVPVIFPDSMVHSFMADAVKDYFVHEAKAMARAKGDVEVHSARIRAAVKPVAAGSIELGMQGTVCHGKSDTLGLASRDEDTSLVCWFPYNHGIKA